MITNSIAMEIKDIFSSSQSVVIQETPQMEHHQNSGASLSGCDVG